MGTKNRLNPDAPVFTPRPSPTGPSPTLTELQQTDEEAAIELAEIDKKNCLFTHNFLQNENKGKFRFLK